MKIKTLIPMRIDRQVVARGETIDVDEALGRRLIGVGRAERATAGDPKPKARRETTEKAAPETTAKD